MSVVLLSSLLTAAGLQKLCSQTNPSHLVDGESHCVHVLSHLPHASAVLLDQTNHEAAAVLSIVRVIVLLIQLDHKLRVCPKRVCGLETTDQNLYKSPERLRGGVMAVPPAASLLLIGVSCRTLQNL